MPPKATRTRKRKTQRGGNAIGDQFLKMGKSFIDSKLGRELKSKLFGAGRKKPKRKAKGK